MRNTHDEPNWSQLWLDLSKAFYNSANLHLKEFLQHPGHDLEAQQAKLLNWLTSFQKNWQEQYPEDKRTAYWQTLVEMSQEVTTLMLAEWQKRFQAKEPVENIHELYAIWLKCCNDVYAKSLKSVDYQKLYKEWLNTTVNPVA